MYVTQLRVLSPVLSARNVILRGSKILLPFKEWKDHDCYHCGKTRNFEQFITVVRFNSLMADVTNVIIITSE